MKLKIWLIISLVLIFFINGCIQKQEISKVETPITDKTEIKIIENQTEVIENETTLLPDCEPNKHHLNKDECKCEYSWKTYFRQHGYCTPIKNTLYSCTKGVEVEVHFEPTSTFEEAEIIINNYDGAVMQFTCWFERRDDPFITVIVKEGSEQEFINQIQKESIVNDAHKPLIAHIA